MADPSELTTANLMREVERLEQLIDLRAETAQALNEEKFHRVDNQFSLVEQLRVEQKADTNAAVAAALAAQKESVGAQTTERATQIAKSEAMTTKSIESLSAKFSTADDALMRVVDDLRTRVVAIEAIGLGDRRQQESHAVTIGQVIAVVAVVVTVAAILVGAFT